MLYLSELLSSKDLVLTLQVPQVLQLVALEKPFNEQVKTYCQAHVDRLREYKISDIKEGDVNPETIGTWSLEGYIII